MCCGVFEDGKRSVNALGCESESWTVRTLIATRGAMRVTVLDGE